MSAMLEVVQACNSCVLEGKLLEHGFGKVVEYAIAELNELVPDPAPLVTSNGPRRGLDVELKLLRRNFVSASLLGWKMFAKRENKLVQGVSKYP